ncbi:MAG: amino acid permease [Lachnospiraceae bacterium]|nr:amino acid permease [Lachnospiraceae bacterium]
MEKITDSVLQNEEIYTSERFGKSHSISYLGAVAISVGSALGWGSFVHSGNSFLLKAGPLGSVLGLLIGAVIMIIIARSYHYMMSTYPDAGGIYAYITEVFGHDRAFLVSWFVFLTYITLLWGNIAYLPIFVEKLLGSLLKFGFSYTIAGGKVWFGEVLFSFVIILTIGLICAYSKRLAYKLMILFSFVIFIGLLISIICAFIFKTTLQGPVQPLFVEGKKEISQVMSIVCMVPWAYIGFESISHSTREFGFSHKKSFGVLVASIIGVTLFYILIVVLSVFDYPDGYDGWYDYISNADGIEGVYSYPVFYVVEAYAGIPGRIVLVLVMISLILSSLIGMILATSRLLYALSEDEVIPKKFSRLNRYGNPYISIRFIIGISAFVPLLGYIAIKWMLDVTTIGTIIAYSFICAAVYKLASHEGDKSYKLTGIVGILLMVALAVLFQIPAFTGDDGITQEAYLLFALWGVLGFLIFRIIVNKDTTRRFGNSIVVWLVMLALILSAALTWMKDSTGKAAKDTIMEVRSFYADDDSTDLVERAFIREKINDMNRITTRNSIVVFVLFVMSSITILSNYRTMKRREKENNKALGEAQSMAYKDPLTGVKSKHAYVEKEEYFNVRIRSEEIDNFGVVVCDVNGLKQVNDTLGHKAGDEYIKNACMMVCKIFKHSPVFRIGGDEFVVTLEGDDYSNRIDLMKALNDMVENNNKTGGVVVAAGISEFEQGLDISYRQVFDRADELMYVRKKELKLISA